MGTAEQDQIPNNSIANYYACEGRPHERWFPPATSPPWNDSDPGHKGRKKCRLHTPPTRANKRLSEREEKPSTRDNRKLFASDYGPICSLRGPCGRGRASVQPPLHPDDCILAGIGFPSWFGDCTPLQRGLIVSNLVAIRGYEEKWETYDDTLSVAFHRERKSWATERSSTG